MSTQFLLCGHVLVGFMLLTAGCNGGIPKDALSMNKTTLEERRRQTRVFDTDDEKKILLACSSLLQDLGFSIDESEATLGLLVGSKDRSAKDAGQIAGAVFMTVMFGTPCRYDEKQKIRASVVTFPGRQDDKKTTVRVTFQRVVWDNEGRVTTLEALNDHDLYQGFFDKLSKSVFLEAQGI